MKDLYTIYDMEAEDFAQPLPPKRPVWTVWLKALAVFFVITLVVFLIVNYQSIKKRLADKQQGLEFIEIEDQDQDGIDDNWEERHGLNVRNPKDATEDLDGDLLNNRQEFYFGTDPHRSDSDRDGYYDNEEVARGFNPYGIGRVDSDADGIYNWWENLFGLDKDDASDAQQDFDGDQLKNIDEFNYRTHPKVADSDLDSVPDGAEVQNGTNPVGGGDLNGAPWISNQQDQDQDGLEIVHEVFWGTDRDQEDTDGDGTNDYAELLAGSNPKGEGEITVELEIPALELKLPVFQVKTAEREAFLAGLKQGAILYPGSAFPATRGNCYIFSSSKSTQQQKGEFKRLTEIKAGDKIIVYVKLNEEQLKKIVYRAEFSEEVSSDDLRIARDYEGHELTLGTTWPPGTDRKIFMVKALIDNPRLH